MVKSLFFQFLCNFDILFMPILFPVFTGMAERMKMFHWSREDLSLESAKPPEKYRKRGSRGNGGWTTKRSFDGLVRRLLHAMMTNDTFTVVSKYLTNCLLFSNKSKRYSTCLHSHMVADAISLSLSLSLLPLAHTHSGWS